MTSPSEPRDELLAPLAADGDTRAFALLMTRHKDGLYRLARRYVGNSDDAFDIVQQSFLAAWQALGRYDPARRFDTWLRAIALNKCRDHGRRVKVRQVLMFSQRVFSQNLVIDPQLDADTRWIADQALDALDRAIAMLPRALKEPLLLTAFEGLTQAEAGQTLGISAKAVETRVYRARRALMAALQHDSPREDR